MKVALKSLVGLGLVAVAFTSLTGCEVSKCDDKQGTCITSLQRFEEAPFDLTPETYTAGGTIRVESFLGNIRFVRGETDKLGVTCTRFSSRAFDKKAEAEADIKAVICTIVKEADKLKVDVTIPPGGTSTSGADVVVKLPANFNGKLEVFAELGDIDFGFTGDTTLFDVLTEQGDITGAIDKITGAKGTTHKFQCGKANSSLGGVAGEIKLKLPASTTPYLVVASGAEVAEFASLPASCTWNRSENGLAFSGQCNDGKVFADTPANNDVAYTFDACRTASDGTCLNSFGKVALTF